MRIRLTSRVLAVAAVVVLARPIGLRADAARWWAHVEALANDGLAGRNTGSDGDKRAAEYIAAQFQRAGLEPAGVSGYLQPIAFKTRRIVESQSSLALVRDGKSEPLALGEDANINMRGDPSLSVDAPLVFAGYGLHVPERGINDLQGLDKYVAVVRALALRIANRADRPKWHDTSFFKRFAKGGTDGKD